MCKTASASGFGPQGLEARAPGRDSLGAARGQQRGSNGAATSRNPQLGRCPEACADEDTGLRGHQWFERRLAVHFRSRAIDVHGAFLRCERSTAVARSTLGARRPRGVAGDRRPPAAAREYGEPPPTATA